MPYTKDQVMDAPHADPDDGLLSEVEEARLYEYYGLPYSDIKSATGLPDAAASTTGYETAGYESAGRDEAMTRSEEELQVGTRQRGAGRARLRKWVETEHVATTVPVGTEHADLERRPPAEGDTGEVEVLPDGSISIPVFQEELVIEKRLVVRERVIVRKHTVTEDRLVEADLRRERVEIDADPEIADRVTLEDGRSWGAVTGEDATIQGGAA